MEGCLQRLRGGFCGYLYHKNDATLAAYTDHVSVKALYYYMDGERWMISNHMAYMVDVLKENNISYTLNEVAAQYMLTYGYMLDNSTFVKDREYGYKHLVDLSGGLDSRMVSWVAHDMGYGYTNQLNIAYSQANYKDDKISKEIAGYLGHEYLFKILDDALWLYDVDEMVLRNNGAAFYSGITGGNRLLAVLNTDKFGIEHTGMIGDAILSTFYHDKEFSYGKPQLGMHRYSEMLSYEFDEKLTEEYPNQEMFAIYTRGILGEQSSYVTRQHYVETASPFMDVDFLETVFSIPFAYRDKHHIYLKWMQDKYPQATKFGWEKWGGVRPKESFIFFRKIRTAQRLMWQVICKKMKLENRDNMSPMEYWFHNNEQIQKYYKDYYNHNINNVKNDGLKNDIFRMFQQGNVMEKGMAITVLAIIRRYYG